jgi:hypothetical protein
VTPMKKTNTPAPQADAVKRHAFGISFWMCVALCLYCGDLFAGQPDATSSVSLPEALFREGKRLMADRLYSEACEKFEESYRLKPSGGTVLHLAVCHIEQGKSLAAWAELHEALRLARRDSRKDREAAAQSRLEYLAKKRTKLSIIMEASEALPRIMITIDGISIPEEHWSDGVPVDPGAHMVVASVQGSAQRQIVVHVDGNVSALPIPIAELRPTMPAVRPESPASEAPATPSRSTQSDDRKAAPAPRKESGRSAPAAPVPPPNSLTSWLTKNAVGVTLLGIGVSSLIVGAYLGLQEDDDGNDRTPRCLGTTCANVSGTLLVTGKFLTVVGAGATIYLSTQPSKRAQASAAPFNASLHVGSRGLAITGQF